MMSTFGASTSDFDMKAISSTYGQQPRVRAAANLKWFDHAVLVGIGLICLSDYVSAIWEVRLARDVFLSPWTVRVAGVPLAEMFVLSCVVLVGGRSLLRSRSKSRAKILPLDWYIGLTLAIMAYGIVIGLITFSENDYWREFLYDVRLPINLAAVYWLVSRIPKDMAQARKLWRVLFVYMAVFFSVNIVGWFVWVYGFGFQPLGALGLGSLILTDAGNVFFLSYIALMGFMMVLTGIEAPKLRWIIGLLGVTSFLLLVISLRRGQMLHTVGSLLPALIMLATRRTLRRLAIFVPMALLVVLLMVAVGFQLGQYVGAFLSLLDRTVASTAVRYVGDENVMLNMQKHDLWLTGLGLGRRYEYVIPIPEGDNLTGFAEDEIGQLWRHTLHVSISVYSNWLRYGVIVGSFLTILPYLMYFYICKQKQRLARDRLIQVLVVTTLVACMTPFGVMVPADPKNAMLVGLLLGLCSATMQLYPRAVTTT